MVDDVVLNKAASVERCIRRIREEYGDDPTTLGNQTKQDAIVLNLQRACETCIDLAMHVVSSRKLGIPQDSRDAFSLLAKAGIVDAPLCQQMQNMVGFRNIAVHEYTRLNLEVIRTIISSHLDDFQNFSSTLLKTISASPE